MNEASGGQGLPNKAKNLRNRTKLLLPGLIVLIRPIRPYKETGFMQSNKQETARCLFT